jgi:hypothetical protein
MFKKKITESKTTPKKKVLDLKNISVENLKLIDTDTGEDITDEVVTEIPQGITTVDFKLTFEIPDDEE